MDKKRILITGATSGIGKEAAFTLAKAGHPIILHGRNAEKAEKVRKEIIADSGNEQVDILLADMFLLSEVNRMAEEFKSKYDRLDVLINNAGGIMNQDREVTTEGLEKTMAINLFAPFLLTQLLTEPLKASSDARIINISSLAHHVMKKPDLDDIELINGYETFRAYGNAKLFVIWMTRHFAQQFKEQGFNSITVNSLHPGIVASNFGTDSKLGFASLFLKLARPFLITPKKGAETLVYLATANDVKSITGKYFIKKKEAKVNEKYYSKANELLVWEYCEKVVYDYIQTMS